eukprot:897312-Pelagomonas_calceolata.AAC.1
MHTTPGLSLAKAFTEYGSLSTGHLLLFSSASFQVVPYLSTTHRVQTLGMLRYAFPVTTFE